VCARIRCSFSASRRKAIQAAIMSRQLAATGPIVPPIGFSSNGKKFVSSMICKLSRPSALRIALYQPVFAANNQSDIKGLFTASFVVELFVTSALSGFDNSTIQLTWRDLMPDEPNASIVYQWNQDANNVGLLSFSETLNFADRSWQFEFHNLLGTDDTIKATDGSILAALIIALILVIIVTIIFVRNR
jgi:hypothetical protein